MPLEIFFNEIPSALPRKSLKKSSFLKAENETFNMILSKRRGFNGAFWIAKLINTKEIRDL